MKVALSQINSTIGDFEKIVRKVVSQIEKAKSCGADLVAFPELTTTGYPPRDLLESPGFVDKNLQALASIAREARGIQVVVGYVERNSRPGGKPFFNAAALCRDGKVAQQYFKNLLPTYDVFDEGRHFEPGKEVGLWGLPQPLGISICEDAWNDKLFWEKRLYARDPIEEQVSAGAEWLLNISSSPFSIGKERIRREMLAALALRHGRPLAYVNLVGGNDELVFDGQSLVVNARGEILAEGKRFEEDLVVADLDHAPAFLQKEPSEIELVFEALVIGIRDYVKKCGFKKVALGLSGGIDSSLTAVLAARAIGPRNVLGVLMPSPYSSRGSLQDAMQLAKNLKISYRILPISSIYQAYRKLFRRGAKRPDLADENNQARIRGNLLMSLSNREKFLILSTGNKSELAVGYCTLYGDMSGGLAAISDLPKRMVYDLARWVNFRKRMIPEPIFKKPPSAELRPNQTDQDTLPPYEILDPILRAYIEEGRSEAEIVGLGFSRRTVRWVLNRVDQNEYKRRQAAPGIRVTSKAFGMGRRFPIARKV